MIMPVLIMAHWTSWLAEQAQQHNSANKKHPASHATAMATASILLS